MSDLSAPIDKLKSFLNELFQFESQDLDFGVYKILHHKRKEIKQFIDELLEEKVTKEFETLTAEEKKKLQQQLDDLKQEQSIKNWLEAKAANDGGRINIYEKDFKEDIAKYKKLEQWLNSVYVSEETQNQIYNHLYQFFSRYYDKGDFISKRRFGKNEKYMVPYNGEETHFYWANHDQYYIKSSETFHQFSFKIPIASGNLSVRFKLTEARVEQGNVKKEDTNYFVFSDKEPEINQQEAVFFFEYRPLTDAEKKEVKSNNKQEDLNNKAYETIKEKHKNNSLLAELWEPETQNDEKPRLLKKLNHYTRKNNYDFFIHKDLKGFLQRELDFYIKSEMVNVDDLYVTEADRHFETLRNNLKEIKVFKNIAETIIDFVSQIEDFQKKLWEKKKFVIQTEWVITIDRLVEYVGEEAARPVLEKVIENKEQVREWKYLFGEEVFDDWDDITIEALCIERKEAQQEMDFNEDKSDKIWKKLPIDTVHFNFLFKENLLNSLSNNILLDSYLDGIVSNSDNYQALELTKAKFNNRITGLYLDPPYNTNATVIIYKNGFKNSSWITLMADRIHQINDLLSNNGMFCITIDDYEFTNLQNLIKRTIADRDIRTTVIEYNYRGRVKSNFATTHEYGIWGIPENQDIVTRLKTNADDIRRNLRRTGTGSRRYESPTLFYAIEVDEDTLDIIEVHKPININTSISNINSSEPNTVLIWPIDNDGIERRWYYGHDRVRNEKNDTVYAKRINGDIQIHYVKEGKPVRRKSVWTGKKYDASTYGTELINDLFGITEFKKFDYPKSIYAVKESLEAMTDDPAAWFMDYFGGSGTTFHATQLMNYEDNGNRKCYIVDQGEYVYSVINPRIKKIAYTYDWKDGKPKNSSMNGLGVFFKYQRLEQYEEALENISFNQDEKTVQQAMEFDAYMPKYFLEFETKGSPALVNTELMKDPWNYQLRIWDGYTYDTEQAVDLVETFNYLIGLHMEKFIAKEFNNTKYKFIYGHDNDATKILVIWRNVKDWSVDEFKTDREVLQQEMAEYEYDALYINDQAHIENYKRIENVFKNKMQS